MRHEMNNELKKWYESSYSLHITKLGQADAFS